MALASFNRLLFVLVVSDGAFHHRLQPDHPDPYTLLRGVGKGGTLMEESHPIESIPQAGRLGDTQTNKPLKCDGWGYRTLLSRGNRDTVCFVILISPEMDPLIG